MIEVLEHEMDFLAEAQNQQYDSIMSLPYSRRKRIVTKKMEDMKRAKNLQNAGGQTQLGRVNR